jgi:hypothetical protein
MNGGAWHDNFAPVQHARIMRNAARPVDRAEPDPAATFRAAVAGLEAAMQRRQQQRPEVAFDSQPPPRKLAPFAAAVGATVHEPAAARPGRPDLDSAAGEIGWGSFVLLYDPAGQDGWTGPFRVVVYLRADLEAEIAADPLIGQVGWSWLTEALDARTAGYRQASGSVTRVVTEGFGTKDGEPMATSFELRASWSPLRPGDLGEHLSAWCDALCTASGLPPLPAGVSALRVSRYPRRSERPRS